MPGFAYNIDNLQDITQAEAYGKVLVDLGKENKNIVALTADLAKSTKIGLFFKAYPERSFNFGIAESNMMGAAAGFAISGKIPYVSTFAIFASMRAAEQVRTDIAYPKLKVRIIATHSGVSFGQAGTTHHCTEDLAIMRSLANMTVIVPADSVETAKVVAASLDYPGPIYVRIGRGYFEPVAYEDEGYEYKIGQAVTLREGKDITVIACGIPVAGAVEAADELKEEGVSLRVINMHTIKPIDQEAILTALTETTGIITAEEHNIIGGLGGAVAEVIAESQKGTKFKRLGLPDIYSDIGYPEELYHRYRLDKEGIIGAVKEMLS